MSLSKRRRLKQKNSTPANDGGGETKPEGGGASSTLLLIFSLSSTAETQKPKSKSSSGLTERPDTFRVIKRKRMPLGWRAMASCTSPHPETDLPEAKLLCLCLLSKRGLRLLRQRSKLNDKSLTRTSFRMSRPTPMHPQTYTSEPSPYVTHWYFCGTTAFAPQPKMGLPQPPLALWCSFGFRLGGASGTGSIRQAKPRQGPRSWPRAPSLAPSSR